MQNAPDIKPIRIKEYEVKQSKYPHVGKLPIGSLLIGPSGSGKTVLLQNMILDIYRDCFSRIYIFSPSIDVDASWTPVKHYIEHDMKIKNTPAEPIYFDHYDPAALSKIISTQHKVTEYMKKKMAIKSYIRYWLLLMISLTIHLSLDKVEYYALYLLEVAIIAYQPLSLLKNGQRLLR